MVSSKARKALRERQLKAAKSQSDALQEAEIHAPEPEDHDEDNSGLDARDPEASAATAASKPKSKKTKISSKRKRKQSAADGDDDEGGESITKPRFIVFVGKLPFSATTPMIQKHFVRLAPTSIRHLTEKGTGRSKGCAFLEFERYDQMEECLKQFHNSLFDDGLGGEKRKINIELTVGGGGGKSRERKEKLRAKNDKLAEERLNRATKRREEGKHPSTKPKQQGEGSEQVTQDTSGIHPSRLAQMRR